MPHRISLSTRPGWFFNRKSYGGIITNIGAHQFDQYLFLPEQQRSNCGIAGE